jgi:propionyl-CoA carboxylase alpha chain
MGLKYRVFHWGTQADAIVVTARTAELLALIPDKSTPDLSKFLVSLMPGLHTDIAAKVGHEVRPGEKLAVIGAMEMQNIIKAENDCVIAEIMTKSSDRLSVDQPIMRFQ